MFTLRERTRMGKIVIVLVSATKTYTITHGEIWSISFFRLKFFLDFGETICFHCSIKFFLVLVLTALNQSNQSTINQSSIILRQNEKDTIVLQYF